MIKVFPISRFIVNGHSMQPAFYPGQNVISFNWAYLVKKPQVGDVVIIKINGKEMIKRIQKVHNNQFFVTGDNANESTDSRDFGLIEINQIIGKVVNSDNQIPCPSCNSPVIGIYGRKDAICGNCGFKLSCCGEP